MKNDHRIISTFSSAIKLLMLLMLLSGSFGLLAQDTAKAAKPSSSKPVKSTFGAIWIIDNQTVDVPVKGTFEFDIQHRFGTVNNGSKDMWGLYAPSNIRLGLDYSPIPKLYVGAGMTKEKMLVDINAKYALLTQTRDNKMPISLSYFANMAIDTRDGSNFAYDVHRLSYFNQVLLARKFSDAFSAQVAPSLSWFNNVEGYVDENGDVKGKMENLHFAISFLGRFKISDKTAIIVNVDQPLTQHPTNNPHPNIAFGFEMSTSSHAFQIFAGNYYNIVPQYNNMFNQNDYTEGQFLIGFNINRLWNF
jgi:Membrane bound beta barrel domain (DUF5777)